MIRILVTLALLLIALLITGVGVAGAAFMFSHPGAGPAVIGIIFAGALVLLAAMILFGALAVFFGSPGMPPSDAPAAPHPIEDDEKPHRKEPCIMCGYDLSNLPRRARCPECGFSYDLDDRAETFAR